MYWDVKSVKPLSDYRIYVEIEDGRKGVFDLKPYLDHGVLRVEGIERRWIPPEGKRLHTHRPASGGQPAPALRRVRARPHGMDRPKWLYACRVASASKRVCRPSAGSVLNPRKLP